MEQRSRIRNAQDWGSVSSLGKAAVLLSCFTPSRTELSLGELARLAGLPKPTAHRLVKALVGSGLMEQAEAGRYRLGLHAIELGDVARLSSPIYRNAEPLLEDLALRTDLVTFLCVPTGFEAVYIARVHTPTQAKHGHLPIGSRLHLALGAGPITILAHLTDEEIDAVLTVPVPALTPFTVVEPDRIRERLPEIRAQGYGVSRRDVHVDTIGVGAAVFDRSGRPCGAISLGGPLDRWNDDRLESVAEEVVRTARNLSRSLGYLEDRLASTWPK